jgi:leader peptidase (prepilin peptidase) / N-methyltransferase
LLTAILFLACYLCFGPAWLTVKFCVFSFLLVGLLFMDAETGLLPRKFTYPGVVLGLAFSCFAPTDSSLTQLIVHAYGGQFSTLQVSLLDSITGAFVGAAFFFVASGLYFLMRKRQGMGGGDFALIAMVGAFLGLKLTLLVIFAAPLVTSIYAVTLMARRAGASVGEMLQTWEIPFGVFISLCSLAAVFFGESVWGWYLSLF